VENMVKKYRNINNIINIYITVLQNKNEGWPNTE